MIEWRLVADSSGDITNHNLLASSSISIKELDFIEFIVKVEDEKLKALGLPSISIGDIPIELEFTHREGDSQVFKSLRANNRQDTRLFYNFFGQSSLLLHFDRSNSTFFNKNVDILARRENALLADKMLNFLTQHIDDAVQICFSRSQISASLERNSKFEFSKLDIVKQSIEHLSRTFTLFKREHKHQWEQELHTSEHGQPTGPDSVDWVLKNLDKLSPSTVDEANIIFNNRGYSFPELPKEVLVKNTDTYENRVINSYLSRIEKYLSKLYTEFNDFKGSDTIDEASEYVRFDHTMSKYTSLALRSKSKEIQSLSQQVTKLRELFSKVIPSSAKGFFPPKMTSYVAKHQHYRTIFQQVEKFNKAPSPNLEGSELLLGLKNLATIYEITCLLSIHKTLETYFSASVVEKAYCEHDFEHGYGGLKKERPIGMSNNYFLLSNSSHTFELEYEPKIYQLNDNSTAGDLINTSRCGVHPVYGPHYFSPDFVLKIRNISSEKLSIVMMDAKYKDKNAIKNHDLDTLTKKYLMNIHQLKTKTSLGLSPIHLVLALFAHEKSGNYASNIADIHSLVGSHPILPQAAGIHFLPEQTDLFAQQITGLISLVETEL